MALTAPPVQVDPPSESARIAPITSAQRSLAPDLARGMMLLFIALANVWGYLYGREHGLGYRPETESVLDHIVDGVVALLVDDRSRPMFAILYGFGIAFMAARMVDRGADPKPVRRLLRRRSLWLIAFGVVHATLLYSGDILAPYGVTGLVALFLVNRRTRTLVIWLVGSVVTQAIGWLLLETVLDDDTSEVDIESASYLTSAGFRLIGSLASTVYIGLFLMFLPLVSAGFFLFRSGWLQRPWDHRRALGRVFAWTAVANLVLNLPWALAVARVWTPGDDVEWLVEVLHDLSGAAMGLGYICLFGWLAARLRHRGRTGVVGAVAATGERSLTCYLLQSLAFAPLLSPWGLGVGKHIGTAQAAALAIVVWLATVGLATWMARRGRRGPFEVLLRRLTYRAAKAPAPDAPTRALPAGGGPVGTSG